MPRAPRGVSRAVVCGFVLGGGWPAREMSGPVTSVVAAEASVHKGHIPMPPGPGPPPISAKSGPARGTDPGGSWRRGEGGGERPEAQHPRGASRREGRSSDSRILLSRAREPFSSSPQRAEQEKMGKRGQPGPGETHGTARAGQQVLVYSGKHGTGRYVHRAYPAPASPGWTLGSFRPGPATGLSSDVTSSGQSGSGAHPFSR